MAGNKRKYTVYILLEDVVRKRLYDLGWSGATLAMEVGIETKQISRFISGERRVKYDVISMFAKALGMSEDDISIPITPDEESYLGMLNDESIDLSFTNVYLGITRNIHDRLLVSHSKEYVNEILELVNLLVLESQYYGVEKEKKNESDKIIENIKTKRRNGK